MICKSLLEELFNGNYDPALHIKNMSNINRPAIPGDNVTFQCCSNLVLNLAGHAIPGLSVCRNDGSWHPDPREMECINRTLVNGELASL